MKNIQILFLFIFLPFVLSAQETQKKKNAGGEPYPAPVAYGNISLLQAALIDEFDNRQVSNLHVHARVNERDDYPYLGSPIEEKYSNLFTGKVSGMTRLEGREPMAVLSMRGEAEELYLVRLQDTKYENELALFGWVNGKMKERISLAYYTCKRNRCIQVDSWLQDINGDTRLDIIQKKKITRKNGKVTIKPTLYLMNQQGMFRKSKAMDLVNLTDYRVHEPR